MAQHISFELFDSLRKSLQRALRDIAYDLMHNSTTSQEEILCLVTEASRTLGHLKRIGQMMFREFLDGSAHEITRVAPIAYFTLLIERERQPPMTEFEWACLYTGDSLSMLAKHILADRTPFDNSCHFEAQAIFWDMRVRFPDTLSNAGYHASPSYDALQIPSSTVVSTPSLTPQLGHDPLPVDTYITYNPERPLLHRAEPFQDRSEPENGPITGLYLSPRIQPR
jgi:hypothetical protein